MSARYRVKLERVGPSDWAVYIWRGWQRVADVRAHRPNIAVRDAVKCVRWLRRHGELEVA